MTKFWPELLPHHEGNSTFRNRSIDVIVKGCVGYYDITACIRNFCLSFVGFICFIFCITCIVRLHVYQQPEISYYIIFYCASLETAILVIKWIALNNLSQMEFIASFLKMMQFVVLCLFSWSSVSRIRHEERLTNWIILPLLSVFGLFFLCITSLGLLTQFSSWEECLAPHWLLLSFAEFLGIQLFLIAGIYITKNMNSVASEASFRRERKRNLWSIIVAYEFSSVVSLAYYVCLQLLGSDENGCSGIFKHTQNIYSPIYALFMVIKYLLPIMVTIFVFYPNRSFLSEEERPLWWSRDGSTTSVFSQNTRHDSYRQLVVPVQNVIYTDQPVFRRTMSSPALLPKQELTSISEENAIIPPSHVHYNNYGAMDSRTSPPEVTNYRPSRTRSRHDSGAPPKGARRKTYKVPVSLNQCSDEMESVTPSSGERA